MKKKLTLEQQVEELRVALDNFISAAPPSACVVLTLKDLSEKYQRNFVHYCIFSLLTLTTQTIDYSAAADGVNKRCINTYDTSSLIEDAAKLATIFDADKRTLKNNAAEFESMQSEDIKDEILIVLPFKVVREVMIKLRENQIPFVRWNAILRMFAYFWLSTWSGTKRQEVSTKTACKILVMQNNRGYPIVTFLLDSGLIERYGSFRYGYAPHAFEYEIAKNLVDLKDN